VAEQSAVPFILYGPEVLREAGNRATAGAHIDIAPTLIELAADQGFAYPVFGENLLTKKSPTIGLGWQYLIGEHYIANDGAEYGIFALAGGERPEVKPDLTQQRTHYNALRALSWQRIKKGAHLP
jgi:phosphoglycerol transferase MdoB-like AlkP superfamily enzyme